MKGNYYKPKGRNNFRVWIHWRGKTIFINKGLDETKLDTVEKAEAVLKEVRTQISLGIFDPELWANNRRYKTEWETRQLVPDYSRMGICGICGEKTKVCQDHDHGSKLIRGKLCRNCNLALGILKENKDILLGALKYLLFWERQDSNRET